MVNKRDSRLGEHLRPCVCGDYLHNVCVDYLHNKSQVVYGASQTHLWLSVVHILPPVLRPIRTIRQLVTQTNSR